MAEVSPKAWIVNAMNTKPGIMNARSWIQAIRKLNLRRTKNRIQSRSMVRLCHGQNAWDRACTELNASRTKMGSRGTKAQLTHDKGCGQSKSMGWLCHGHSPSDHETPKAEFRQDKLKSSTCKAVLAAGAGNFSNMRKPSPALWGPRKTTIQEDQQLCFRGYKEAPNKGPVHGLSFGSKQASRTVR